MASPRVSGARLEHLFQQAREPAFWLNAERKLVWVNRAWEGLTGHAAGSVAGLVCQAHGPNRDGDLPGVGGSFFPPAEALAGRPASTKTLVVHPSGERQWRRVEYWPFHNDAGELVAILGLVRSPDESPLLPDAGSQHLRAELMEVRDRLLGRYGLDSVIGHGPAHRRLLDQMAAAAASEVSVMIVGEPGTGKRLVARTIHQLGKGRQSSIVSLDCAALPADVLERQLFGPCRDDEAPSLLPQLALPDGSTLLLYDVLDLPRDLQGRLASALNARTRLLASTTGDVDLALREGRLRPDLYYLLTTLVIRLVPLRDRLDEIPLLAQHLLERTNLRGGRQRQGFRVEALEALAAYDWPGNLRELHRVVDDAHGRGSTDLIDVDDLPTTIRGNLGAAYNIPSAPSVFTPLDELLTQVERRVIEKVLQLARNNKSRAAELLGISRPRLYRRIKELNLPDEPDVGDDVADN